MNHPRPIVLNQVLELNNTVEPVEVEAATQK